MVKIVGKFLIILFSIISFIDARISLEIRTNNGTTNQVVVGQPFTLDVVIDELYGSVPTPTIKGLEKFNPRQCGSYMSSVNGKATARYSYEVRIDKMGSYTLGPATITYQQQNLVSNELQVDVVKDIGVIAPQNKNTKVETKTFLRLMILSESVVVGQKIGCVLRFYYQDPGLSLTNVGSPELPSFDVKENRPLEHGTAEIDGIEYRYVQWQWDMYPTKPGEFLIPAYSADYEVQAKDNNMFAGFFMLNRVERKRVYSNAVTIKVLPLPYSQLPISAVGTFERFSAEIKPGMAKEGEGMVLTLEIEGDGNLQALATPQLNLPNALKYYDSNSSIIAPKHSDEFGKKRFEFIVQGMKPGDCEIPEQFFTYFDIETNKYVTLRTAPLAVSIMPGTTGTKKNIITPTISIESNSNVVSSEALIADIDTVGLWYPVAERQPLPWWLFQLLLLLPCLYIGYPFVADKFIVLTGNSARLMRWRAFRSARKQIAQVMKTGDDKKLYAIFMQLLQQLGKNSVPVESAEFFEQVMHATYAQSDNRNSDELCRMAQQWLERLEKII